MLKQVRPGVNTPLIIFFLLKSPSIKEEGLIYSRILNKSYINDNIWHLHSFDNR